MAHENHLLGGHVSSQEGTFYSLGTKSSYTGCVCVCVFFRVLLCRLEFLIMIMATVVYKGDTCMNNSSSDHQSSQTSGIMQVPFT